MGVDLLVSELLSVTPLTQVRLFLLLRCQIVINDVEFSPKTKQLQTCL